MIIKTKKAGINYEFGVKIYTLIYIKLIMKKDLLNRTGDSTEQRINIHLCIIESSSCAPKTNKTMEINSTPI